MPEASRDNETRTRQMGPVMSAYVEKARNDLGDWNVEGGGRRKAGWVDAPVHPAEGVELEPTDWVGNPDSPAAAAAQKQLAE